jgi:DNA-binding NarL/FixJ family response regulator/signal transduction histidine kinase
MTMRNVRPPAASTRVRSGRIGDRPTPDVEEPVAAGMRDELQALAAGALHMTVYDLLAHAYNRVAIQYYRDKGDDLLRDLQPYSPTMFAPTLPTGLRRDVVNALLSDAARALSTFFGFAEMNFILLDHEHAVYRLGMREGPYFPHFQPGVYTQPFATGLLGQCHLGRCTVLENDVSASDSYISNDPAVRSELCVPVVEGADVLAIIDSGAYTVDAFTDAHVTFIEDFARYLAPAISDPLAFLQSWRPGLVHGTSTLAPLAQSLNFLYVWHEEWRSRFAQLYTEAAQRNAELMALTDLSTTLSTSLRLDTILATTVAKVAELLSCQVSWILLPDDDGLLRIRAQHGGTVTKAAEFGVVLADSPQSRVFATGEPLITNSLDGVSRSGFDWSFCRRNQIARYATVPLRVRERPIGVMNVGRVAPSEELTEQDIRLLSTFAGQIALAIENAELYEHSRLLGAAEERARLARDLHDTLAQSMLMILRNLDGLETTAQNLPESLLNRVSQARALARQSLDDARRSVWNLQAAALEHATFREALEQYIATWSAQAGVRAKFERKGQPSPLTPHIESELLLITREALQNVARHAAATSVIVTLQYGAAGLRLLISDDGKGFDAQAREGGPDDRIESMSPGSPHMDDQHSLLAGMGLRGMRERARLFGGMVQIESAPGWGTRIAITVQRTSLEQTSARVPRAMLTAADVVVGEREAADASDTTIGTSALSWPLEDVPHEQATGSTNGAAAAGATGETRSGERAITVLLADDHPALREGLRQALDAIPGIQVVGAASTVREARELMSMYQPDVMLLDMRLPDDDSLALLRETHPEATATQVVMFTAYNDDAHVVAALQAGATGYLSKDIATPHLIAAIRAAASGRRVFSPDIAARLRGREGLLVNLQAGRLTPREREILTMLAEGLRYRTIAQRLCVTEATVKFHVLNLYQKLQSSSRVEALNQARQWGLLK